MKPTFRFNKPRPKGWRSHKKPRPATYSGAAMQMCSPKERQLREQHGAMPPKRGRGYLLANCLVLAAAVVATKQAYWSAREQMRAAREADSWRYE